MSLSSIVLQLLKQMFVEAFPSQSGRFPVAVLCIDVLPSSLDVNLEPNKTTVLFHDMVSVSHPHAALWSHSHTAELYGLIPILLYGLILILLNFMVSFPYC